MMSAASLRLAASSELLMSVQYVQPLLQAVQATQARADVLLQPLGVAEPVILEGEAELPFAKLLEAWQLAMQLCQDPMLPLNLGQLVHPGNYGFIGQLAQSAATLGDALEFSVRYEHLLNHSFSSEILIQDEVVYDRLLLPPLPVDMLRPVVEYDFAAAVSFGYFLLNDTERRQRGPLEVHFRHAAVGSKASYERFFGCPVRFNADHNQVLLSRQTLQQKLPSADPLLFQHMLEYASRRGSQLKTPVPEVVQRLERLVAPALPYGMPELKTVAETLGMSVSTLKRRLQEHDTNYLAVCDALRCRLACQYVLEPERNLVDVAFLLGFSELSTFYRAFKRWTGVPPQQYRKQHEQGHLL